MTRFRYLPARPAPHELDEQTQVCVERLLEGIGRSSPRRKWYCSRSTDIIRLRCDHDDLQIKLTHVVPEGHQDYVPSVIRCGGTGTHVELLTIEVVDISNRSGRVMMADEWFRKASPLFGLALETFNAVRAGAKIVDTSVVDRAGYANAIAEAAKAIM